jgi:hypothetical protein
MPSTRLTQCLPSIVIAASLAFAALMNSGCEQRSATRVRLAVQYQDDWQLGSLDIGIGERTITTALAHQVIVIVPDDWADKATDIDVWGVRNDARLAHGSVSVTPKLGSTVDAEVVLVRMPCGPWCDAGEVACLGDGLVTCVQDPETGCTEWSAPQACPDDAPHCSLGECGSGCVDECATGETICEGPGAVRTCGESDGDPCLDWSTPVACVNGEVCSNGACGEDCQDECAAGDTHCSGDGVVSCGDRNDDGCMEWGPPVACGDDQTCSEGECQTSCTDECSTDMCSGLTFSACGQYDSDACLDRSPGVSCQPSNQCLIGSCSPTGCATQPVVCNDPPDAYCVDHDTKRVFQSSGVCSGGDCDYTHHDVFCPNCPSCDACAGVTCETPPSVCFADVGTCSGGDCTYGYANGVSCNDSNACTVNDTCSTGVCSGTPKVCNTPPPPVCVNDDKLRTFSATGMCSSGVCQYAHHDDRCPDHGMCVDGACVPECNDAADGGCD